MIPVPFVDLTFLTRIRGTGAGTSNRRHRNGEKTNPCEAVKPEIPQRGRGADILSG
jgi:hypothetical protein